jgi:hypothetical protein
MEIRPGFASACRMKIGDMSVPISVEDHALVGTIEVDGPIDPVVKLMTPPTLRPSVMRDSSDRRTLGLAIPIAAANLAH